MRDVQVTHLRCGTAFTQRLPKEAALLQGHRRQLRGFEDWQSSKAREAAAEPRGL